MFGRRVALLLLFVLVLVSVSLRYPMVEHERYQTDSYFIHGLSVSIVDNQMAIWLVHPLSYLGYYPFSYPSGIPFVIAEFSEMTGVNVELSILVLDFVVAIIFCLASFILVRHFLRKMEYVILATFFTIAASRFVDTTYWDGSARGPMVAILVLVVFTMLRSSSHRSSSMLIVGGMFAFGCLATHHMAVLMILFALAYIMTVFQTNLLFGSVRRSRRTLAAVYNSVAAISVTVVAFGMIGFLSAMVEWNFRETGLVALESTIASVIFNMAWSYTNQIGFILPLAIIGIPFIFKYRLLTFEILFPVSVIIAFIPLLGDALYVSMIIAPFVAILFVEGTLIASRDRMTKRRSFLLVLLIAGSLLLPIWSIDRWNDELLMTGDTVTTDCQLFDDAAYLEYVASGEKAISNSNVMSLQLESISGVGFLGSGMHLVINGDISAEEIRANTTWSSAPFPSNLYKWFVCQNAPPVDSYVRGLMVYGYDYLGGEESSFSAREYFEDHSKIFVVVDKRWSDELVGMYSIVSAELPSEMKSSESSDVSAGKFSSFLIYESERCSVFAVQLLQ